jgi:hypothetical protein
MMKPDLKLKGSSYLVGPRADPRVTDLNPAGCRQVNYFALSDQFLLSGW